MEALDVTLGELDGILQRIGDKRRSTFELRFRDKKVVRAGAVNLCRNGAEGTVAVGLDALENSADTRLNEAVVEHGTLAQRRP